MVNSAKLLEMIKVIAAKIEEEKELCSKDSYISKKEYQNYLDKYQKIFTYDFVCDRMKLNLKYCNDRRIYYENNSFSG